MRPFFTSIFMLISFFSVSQTGNDPLQQLEETIMLRDYKKSLQIVDLLDVENKAADSLVFEDSLSYLFEVVKKIRYQLASTTIDTVSTNHLIWYNHWSDSLMMRQNQMKLEKARDNLDLTNKQLATLEKEAEILKLESIHAETVQQNQKLLKWIIQIGITVLFTGLLILLASKWRKLANEKKILQLELDQELTKAKEIRTRLSIANLGELIPHLESLISKDQIEQSLGLLTDYSKLMRAILEASFKQINNLDEELTILQLLLKCRQSSPSLNLQFEDLNPDELQIEPLSLIHAATSLLNKSPNELNLRIETKKSEEDTFQLTISVLEYSISIPVEPSW